MPPGLWWASRISRLASLSVLQNYRCICGAVWRYVAGAKKAILIMVPLLAASLLFLLAVRYMNSSFSRLAVSNAKKSISFTGLVDDALTLCHFSEIAVFDQLAQGDIAVVTVA